MRRVSLHFSSVAPPADELSASSSCVSPFSQVYVCLSTKERQPAEDSKMRCSLEYHLNLNKQGCDCDRRRKATLYKGNPKTAKTIGRTLFELGTYDAEMDTVYANGTITQVGLL